MKPLLTFAFIAFAATLQTQTTETGSDLVVLKFSWSKYVIASGLIHPVEADPAPGPLVINRNPTRDPNYQRPAPAPHERSSELSTLEQKAAISTSKASTLYVIRIQVKNTGLKPIKSFVWEYKDSAGGQDAAGRQFLCAVKAKPNETKTLEILSPVAPSPVVDHQGTKHAGQASALACYQPDCLWRRVGLAKSRLGVSGAVAGCSA